jgi:peptidoglycan/LPS O-acetylase OafA/YrhL
MQVESAVRPTHHLEYIDALRGVGIIAVITVHVGGMVHPTGHIVPILPFFTKGVQLFFIISALTLMMSMKIRNLTEKNALLNFFVRRVFRIAPTFYAILLVYCILGWVADPTITGIQPTSAVHALEVMSFFNGWHPDLINAPVVGQWAIAVEMMFYLLLPLIFPLVTSFRRAVYAWWGTIVLYLFSYPLANHLATLEGFKGSVLDFAYWWLPNQLPIFMSGIGLYFILTKKPRLYLCIVSYLPGAILLLVLHHFFNNVGLLPLVGIAISSGVAVVARMPFRLIVNRFTRFLGKISFSAYLCHPLILPIVRTIVSPARVSNANLRLIVSDVVAVALVCPIAYAMWAWIEKPSQSIGRLVIERMSVESPR